MGEDTKRKVVLIIDDEAGIREILADYFSEKYDVVTAINGQDAIDKIESMLSLPCVVFLDLMMPVMNGWQFLEHVEHRGLLPGVRVIVTSAVPQEKSPSGINFLSKPYSVSDVEDYCEACCCPECEDKK